MHHSRLLWHRFYSAVVEPQRLPLTLRFCYITVGHHHLIDLVHVCVAPPLTKHVIVLFILIHTGTMDYIGYLKHIMLWRHADTSYNDVSDNFLVLLEGLQ